MLWRRRLFLHEKIVELRVIISTPDKDLAQCVLGTRVVQLDRRRRLERDQQGVMQKFGVKPSSIPDYLPWSVTRPMDIPDCQDGVPSLLLPFSLVLADWKRSHPTHGSGR
jgi:hypothetical protein